MGTKNNPGKFDCYAAAEPDEPMFVMLGRDPHAYAAVRKWADDRIAAIEAGIKPETDMEIVDEARLCADAMEDFSIQWARRRKEEEERRRREEGRA